MKLNELPRKAILKALRMINDVELLGIARQARYGTFEQRKIRQRYALCDIKENYVVDTRDNIIGRVLFETGEFDFDKFLVAKQIIQESRRTQPTLLIDIGANIGTICIPAISRGLMTTAIAIEPGPDNCRLLRANIELNESSPRIKVYEMAVGPRDEQELRLELSDENMGDHRIGSGDSSSGRPFVTVRSSTLDTILTEHLEDDMLLWMDVQGFEGMVLSGAKKILSKKPPLVMEFWPRGMQASASFEQITSALSHYDYFIDLAKPRRKRPLRDLDALYKEIGLGDDPPRSEDFSDILVL